MIRGKKNYVPACQLQMGFGVMFQLDKESLGRHAGERKTARAMETEDGTVDQDDGKDDEIYLSASEEERNSDAQINDFPDVQARIFSIRVLDDSY